MDPQSRLLSKQGQHAFLLAIRSIETLKEWHHCYTPWLTEQQIDDAVAKEWAVKLRIDAEEAELQQGEDRLIPDTDVQ